MSGPQPCSPYPAGSRYQVGKDPEKREGFEKVLENQDGFVGTAVGSIPFANTSYILSVEMQEGFFADPRNDEHEIVPPSNCETRRPPQASTFTIPYCKFRGISELIKALFLLFLGAWCFVQYR